MLAEREHGVAERRGECVAGGECVAEDAASLEVIAEEVGLERFRIDAAILG